MTLQENYSRAKETHGHTQQLWEKEIRRARKETFKAQSALVKCQEELKSSRAGQKSAEEAMRLAEEDQHVRHGIVDEAEQKEFTPAGAQHRT